MVVEQDKDRISAKATANQERDSNERFRSMTMRLHQLEEILAVLQKKVNSEPSQLGGGAERAGGSHMIESQLEAI